MPNYQNQFGAFQFAMKDRYDKVKMVRNLTEGERPLLAMLAKETDFSGDGTHVPLIFGRPQGVAVGAASPSGGSLATAQANTSNLEGKKFILTAGEMVGSVKIADKTIQAARNNMGAFFKNRAAECDNLIEQMADDIAHHLYGNGGLALARSSTSVSVSGNVITLENVDESYAFEVGMTISASSDDGTGGVAGRTGSAVITAVDRENGTITVDSIAGITGFADGDYIFRDGTYSDSGDTDRLLVGLSGYLWSNNNPPPLYSMTRTADPTRLAGCRLNADEIKGKSSEQRLRALGTAMTGRYKGKGGDYAFVNPEDWDQIVTSLSARGIRSFKDDSTKFGFEVIEFTAGGKRVKLVPDPFCPKGVAFILRMKDWKLWSMGELIAPLQEDGQIILRGTDNNSYEFRARSYPVLACMAPGYSGRVPLS